MAPCYRNGESRRTDGRTGRVEWKWLFSNGKEQEAAWIERKKKRSRLRERISYNEDNNNNNKLTTNIRL